MAFSGLGRGLDSLIPQKKNTSASSGNLDETNKLEATTETDDDIKMSQPERVANIPVNRITVNPYQPRKNFDLDELQELADSIREHGIIQPLIVTKVDDGWQLVAGERRWRAAKLLGLGNVPAIVRELDKRKKMEIALIENVQRKNLNPMEAAVAYKKLIDEFGATIEELSKKVGKSTSGISNLIRLLKLRKEVQDEVRAGRLAEGKARSLIGLPEEDQLVLLNKFQQENITTREAERISRSMSDKKLNNRNVINKNPELDARVDSLQKVFGTKVDIVKKGEIGHFMIRFFSNEEYNEIYKKLNKSE